MILLDEPTSHLDFKNQSLVLGMVDKLSPGEEIDHCHDNAPSRARAASLQPGSLMSNGNFLAIGDPDEVMTEETLGKVYGMLVRIISVNDQISGKKLKFVIPTTSPTVSAGIGK